MKKKILAACLVVCLLATAVIGTTLAYFTDTKEVTNTFTVGKVSITLDETDVDLYGVKDGETRVTQNDYKLIPGRTYTKDPTIHVAADSEDCYLFVKVTNGISGVINELNLTGWTRIENSDYYYYGANPTGTVAKANDDAVVFSNFTVKSDVNADDLNAVDNQTIIVTAYAIQADGFDTAIDAWTAAKLA